MQKEFMKVSHAENFAQLPYTCMFLRAVTFTNLNP